MKNKSLIFIGAGATAQLMGSTAALENIIYYLFADFGKIEQNKYFSKEHTLAFQKLIEILNPNTENNIIKNFAQEYAETYKINEVKVFSNLLALRKIYDFESLEALTNTVADRNGKRVNLMLLYTTIDLLIKEQGGFQYKEKFYDLTRIRLARNLLNLLIQTVLFCQSAKSINEPDKFLPYKKFINELVELTRIESIELANEFENDFTNPKFINFHYSIVSFNWEPIILGLLFEAHRDFNHSNRTPYLGEKCLRLRLFNDFGLTIGSLRKDTKTDVAKVWYQGHESIAIRVNDADYPSRIMRVGKFLFPHGSLAFRMCPVCRKTNFVVRGIDKILNYFGPGILPEFNEFHTDGLLTEKEKIEFEKGNFDSLECYSCGNIMRINDTPLIMQTAYKDKYPPILEESLYDLTVQLKNANHLIFIGYKCSEDDVIYRSKIFSALAENEEKKVSVVLFDKELFDNKWYNRKELGKIIKDDNISEETKKTIKNFLELFPSEKQEFRISFKGFPNAIEGNYRINSKKFFEFN